MTSTRERRPARWPWTALCGLVALGAAGAATAADAEGNYAVWGVGRASCHQFDKAFKAGQVDAYKAFLAGYLTAYNVVTRDIYQATGQRTLQENLAELDALCAQSPMESYERAIQALIAKTATADAERKPAGAWGRAAPSQ